MVGNWKSYSETFIDRQPKDWGTQKLSNIIKSLDAGVSVNSDDRPANEDEIGILKTSSVKNGKLIPYENKVVKPDEIERVKINPIKDSIIISRMNTPELVGEIAYVNKDFDNLFLPDRLWQTSYKKNVSGKWLAYLLSLPYFRSKVKNMATGTSNSMKNISKKEFLSLKVPSLNYEEQQKIASILFAWDKAIELKKRLIEHKKEQKKGLMQKLLTGEVRLPGFDGEWERNSFEDIFVRISAKKHQIKTNEYLEEGEYPVVDQGKKRIAAFSNEVDKVFEVQNQGIIIFGDHTRELKYIDFNFIVGADGTQLLETKKGYNIKFYYYHLLIQKTPNTGYNRHFKFLKDMWFYKPLEKEQEAIAQVLSTTGKKIELLEKEVEQLKLQKRGLMQLLLTGKVRVKV